MPVAQRVSHIPADADQDHIDRKAHPFEVEHVDSSSVWDVVVYLTGLQRIANATEPIYAQYTEAHSAKLVGRLVCGQLALGELPVIEHEQFCAARTAKHEEEIVDTGGAGDRGRLRLPFAAGSQDRQRADQLAVEFVQTNLDLLPGRLHRLGHAG